MNNSSSFCQFGLNTLNLEIEALIALRPRIDHNFSKACELILQIQGRLIVTGIGKSGHVGRKIASTFASTGSPTFFLHPGEASHGDLGMITRGDTILIISNSGETPEILLILPLLKQLGVTLIAMTGNPKSTLAKAAQVNLDVSVAQEACPLGLAPTSSTTATLVMGDALAMAVLQARGFNRQDFAFAHPGGSLGRRLLVRVADIMRAGDEMPMVLPTASLQTALIEITRKRLGMAAIVDADRHILGIFTDGDLRRTIDKGYDVRTVSMADVMTPSSKIVRPELLAADAFRFMEDHKITSLLVENEQHQLIGILHMHDVLEKI